MCSPLLFVRRPLVCRWSVAVRVFVRPVWRLHQPVPCVRLPEVLGEVRIDWALRQPHVVALEPRRLGVIFAVAANFSVHFSPRRAALDARTLMSSRITTPDAK